jgi:hypothetical protein
MGTTVNIELLLIELRGALKRDGLCCIFVDSKSAYNTVRRDLLYGFLEKKAIFPTAEVNFLRCLYNSLYFRVGAERIYLQHGMHQGSPISPVLFDVYMEEYMNALQTACRDAGMWYKVYADDLVIIVDHTHV